jgi:hypothetical protein
VGDCRGLHGGQDIEDMDDDEPNESDPDPVPPTPGMAPEVETFEGEQDLAVNILTMEDQWVSMGKH